MNHKGEPIEVELSLGRTGFMSVLYKENLEQKKDKSDRVTDCGKQ